ncbi:MAG TPA: HlyD family secretion protein [Sphingomicrobium sp.]
MSLSRSTIAALILSALVFVAAAYGLVGRQSDGTDNAYVRGDVTPVGIKVAGLVGEVLVRDNQEVRAGDILFRLDDRDYRARVDEALAVLAARKAELAALDSRLARQRSAIFEARATLRSARAEADRSGRELARIEALRSKGWVTRARGDEALAASERALAGVSGAGAGVTGSTAEAGVIESQRPQLMAAVQAAEAALRLARIDLESTVVRAPADGRVAERQARKGQYVRPGTPLIALVSGDVWVVANFKETELRGMRAGERVSITVDALPGRTFDGRVDSLSPASGAQFALLPPDNATGNFTRIVQRIPIRISIGGGPAQRQDLRPGMSARVRRER